VGRVGLRAWLTSGLVCSVSILPGANSVVEKLFQRTAEQLAVRLRVQLLPLYELSGVQRAAILGTHRAVSVADTNLCAVAAWLDTHRLQPF
jgi:hypothetical protein